jgi:hypothetical protein
MIRVEIPHGELLLRAKMRLGTTISTSDIEGRYFNYRVYAYRKITANPVDELSYFEVGDNDLLYSTTLEYV